MKAIAAIGYRQFAFKNPVEYASGPLPLIVGFVLLAGLLYLWEAHWDEPASDRRGIVFVIVAGGFILGPALLPALLGPLGFGR